MIYSEKKMLIPICPRLVCRSHFLKKIFSDTKPHSKQSANSLVQEATLENSVAVCPDSFTSLPFVPSRASQVREFAWVSL